MTSLTLRFASERMNEEQSFLIRRTGVLIVGGGDS